MPTLVMEPTVHIDYGRRIVLSAWYHPMSGKSDGAASRQQNLAKLLWREAGSPLPHKVHLGPFILIESLADHENWVATGG
jgi:hypothetical protein